jgi:alpha-beta hydrolase superfamily lysophospholipase
MPCAPIVRLASLSLLLATTCLWGCGYSRMPAKGPAATAAATPDPLWPVNHTDLAAVRIERKTTLSDRASARDSATLVVEATPVGQGWISWRQDASERKAGDPVRFRYCAWRTPPVVCETIADPLERLLALEASASFRMGFRLWMPETGEPKGLVIHQWGLQGERYERRITEALRRSGWAVLAYDGLLWRPGGAFAVTGASDDALSGDNGKRPSRRDTEAEIDARRTAVAAAASLAAREFDDMIGQYVLGQEAALIHVRQRFPALAERPLAVIGCSLGSLMTPALVTRLGDEVRACVLVGSGANMLRITGDSWQDSYYSRVRRGTGDALSLPSAERDHLLTTYLERTTLDPYVTAAALRRIPTLMLHATWDSIVPAASGDLLWEQAGRPERWSGAFGHIWMFLTLDGVADDLVAWLDRAVATPTAPAAPAGSTISATPRD